MVVCAQHWPSWVDALTNLGHQSIWIIEEEGWTQGEWSWIKDYYVEPVSGLQCIARDKTTVWMLEFVRSSRWWMGGDYKWLELQMQLKVDKEGLLKRYFNVSHHISYETVGGVTACQWTIRFTHHDEAQGPALLREIQRGHIKRTLQHILHFSKGGRLVAVPSFTQTMHGAKSQKVQGALHLNALLLTVQPEEE
eukprot:12791920-Ditylum_brightwellii.AAC.1